MDCRSSRRNAAPIRGRHGNLSPDPQSSQATPASAIRSGAFLRQPRLPRALAIPALAIAVLSIATPVTSVAADAPAFTVESTETGCRILAGDAVIGSYVTSDPAITRPFWCNLKTLTGRSVTRSHPPAPGDLDDHPTMHPGIWIAFGDVSGNDYWRLKAVVRHAGWVEPPAVVDNVVRFAARNEYLAAGRADALMEEVTRWTARPVADGWLLTAEARFIPTGTDARVVFGDQEEMGLGVRAATAIAERSDMGGRVRDADGRESAAKVWGQTSSWCDYSSISDAGRFGLTVYPAANNFRPCWWHVRDTGLMVANPFGRKALTGGEPSEVPVSSGEPLPLRFAIRIYDSPAAADAGPSGFAPNAAEILNSLSP
jgi:hypothetical protein